MKFFLQTLAKLFYAVILPAYLLWFVLAGYYEDQRQQQLNQLKDIMEESLELVSELHEDNAFFNALLKKNLAAADNHQRPTAALKARIKALHRRFPGSFKFIVFDSNGRLDVKISEEKRFRYVLETMAAVMKEVYRRFLNKPDAPVPETVHQKIKLLRGYFGQFLLATNLVDFFKPGFKGRATDVSTEEGKRKLWYYVGRNFSAACLISDKAINKEIGPTTIVNNFNNKHPSLRLGYAQIVNDKLAGLPRLETDRARIKLAVKKYELSATDFFETGRFLILLKQISPELITFCYCDKTQNLLNTSQEAKTALASILKWAAILAFIIYCGLLRQPDFSLSIRQKFLILLFFTNGLPALILVSTGYEYFNQKKAAVIENLQQESIKILQELDQRYPSFRKLYARRLNSFIAKKNRQHSCQRWSQESLKELETLIKNLESGKVFLIDRNDKNLMSHLIAEKEDSDNFIEQFFIRSLDFINTSDINRKAVEGKSALENLSSEDLIFSRFNTYLNRISSWSSAQGRRWVYFKQLGDYQNFNSWGFLALIWSPNELLNLFLHNSLAARHNALAPRKLAVMNMKSQTLYPESLKIDNKLRRLIKVADAEKISLCSSISMEGKNYLFAAVAGNEMKNTVLAAFYPAELVDQRIDRFKFMLFLATALILLALFKVGQLFSHHILKPVKDIADGFEHIRQERFNYRVEPLSRDEIGNLSEAFNSSLESLEKLSVGTAVQKNLLPAHFYRSHKIEVFTRSLFMTRMGGDYCDYFASSPEKLSAVFGDVAGHGIPAAIIVAAIKAAFVASAFEHKTPVQIIEKANEVLSALKERKIRRIMTCQALEIDCLSAKVKIANAGQCFPIIVGKNAKSTRFIEIEGYPLGTRLCKATSERIVELEPGEIMILYSDGIIEAMNESGEQFGYSRFKELLITAWNSDLQTYWQNIIDANTNWRKTQDDDLTFMLIKHCDE